MADYILQVFEWPKSLGSAGINYIEESNRQESQVNTEKCIWHCIHSMDSNSQEEDNVNVIFNQLSNASVTFRMTFYLADSKSNFWALNKQSPEQVTRSGASVKAPPRNKSL